MPDGRQSLCWVTAAFLVLAGCHAPAPLPEIPEISTASFSPAIRQAVNEALAAAKAQPKDAAAVGRLGMVLHTHQQFEAARACYRRASLLDSKDFAWLYYLGVVSEGKDSIETLRAALRLRDYLPAKLKLGDALLALGDTAGAREVVQNLDHPAALFAYGRATGDLHYYEKALARFPQFGAAMFALSQEYQRAGRVDEARRLMADYQRFKTVAPPVDDPMMRAVDALNRGADRLLRQAADLEARGDLSGAVDLHLKALELDSRLSQAHVNLISLYGRLGDLPAAEMHFRQAVQAAPNSYEAYYNFGVLCFKAKRRREAEAAFEKALAINPGMAEAHNNLGALFQESGRLAEAAEHFRKAIENQPGYRLAHFHLGRIYANQGRFSQAIEQFKQAATVDDESTPAYLYALGATQARAGNAAGAIPTLTQARERALARGQSPLAASIDRDLKKLRRP